MKPLSQFKPDSDETTEHPPEVLWARILDKRFCYEVKRTDDAYKGKLVIFDSKNDYQLLHELDVTITYGAPFGPDMYDTNEWDEYVMNWIDNTFTKEEKQ